MYYRVLLCTTGYYVVLQRISLYYRVLLCTTEYYFALQSITFVLQSAMLCYRVPPFMASRVSAASYQNTSDWEHHPAGRASNRVSWKPEIHRHWDLLSRRTVELLLLCQQRQSHGGLAAIVRIVEAGRGEVRALCQRQSCTEGSQCAPEVNETRFVNWCVSPCRSMCKNFCPVFAHTSLCLRKFRTAQHTSLAPCSLCPVFAPGILGKRHIGGLQAAHPSCSI